MKLSLKKIILRIIIGLVVFVGACTTGLFAWVAFDTVDSATAADEFLFALRERRIEDAYALTSAHFQARQDEDWFDEVARLVGLPLAYELDPWRDRTLELTNRSRIRGWLIDLGGEDVRFTLDMVRETGEWRVLSFTDAPRHDCGPGAWFRMLPLREDLYALTNRTITDFAEAIKKGDFTDFYEDMSLTFKIGVSLGRLQQAYQEYIDAGIDITGVGVLEPVYLELPEFTVGSVGFEEASYEIEDVIVIEGYYPLEPLPVPFKFRYVYQHPEWKLFQLYVQQPTIEMLSPEVCLQWLLRQEEQDFSQCFSDEE